MKISFFGAAHELSCQDRREGLLRWARNNDLIDTTAGKWQDSGNGSGIVLYDRTKGVPPIVRRTSFQAGPVRSHSSSAVSAGSEDSQNATHYVDAMKEKNPLKRWFKKHLTAKGWSDMVLRKTVRRNTWIYVAVSDKHFNLFIGIKDTGAFQHSSFLAGGLVTSAGPISSYTTHFCCCAHHLILLPLYFFRRPDFCS
ncbi:hypothetical protein DFH11DRAFT_49324 [Phellopilus nigrolimitatus]|nr:hypothetical protein DFH11DRAFT_49324 [Phellopilus nigrolimitatus]